MWSPTHDAAHNEGRGEEHQQGEQADHDDQAGRLVPRLHSPQADQLIAQPPRGAKQREGGEQPDQDRELAAAVKWTVAINSLNSERESDDSFFKSIPDQDPGC